MYGHMQYRDGGIKEESRQIKKKSSTEKILYKIPQHLDMEWFCKTSGVSRASTL